MYDCSKKFKNSFFLNYGIEIYDSALEVLENREGPQNVLNSKFFYSFEPQNQEYHKNNF